jgi:hypothetical protein
MYFPSKGNHGEYTGYNVFLKERKRKDNCLKNAINLGKILERAELDEHYPHTVGYLKVTADELQTGEMRYLENRRIHNVDEFWLFLNSLNL